MQPQAQDHIAREAPPDEYLTWSGSGSTIWCSASLLRRLIELSQAGFRRYPWGGVEIGGILLGHREPRQIVLQEVQLFNCQHEYGPAFELTAPELEAFRSEVATPPSGLISVGWFHTLSKPQLTLQDSAAALHSQCFPDGDAVAMVLRRSKADPPEVAFYTPDAACVLRPHAPAEAITPHTYRRAQSWMPQAPEVSEPIPVVLAHLPELSPDFSPDFSMDASNAIKESAEASHEPTFTTEPAAPALRDHLAYLGLKQDPFASEPDADFFCPFPTHRQALTKLFRRVQGQSGFVALIGDSGTGKTLLLQRLIHSLESRSIACIPLLRSDITVRQFYEFTAAALHLQGPLENRASGLAALRDLISRQSAEGRTTVLTVDNAHELSVDVLEAVYELAAPETRGATLLQVIFVAQPSFERQLENTPLQSLSQRVLTRARLEPLSAAETTELVETRLAKAGLANQTIFSADVLLEIHARTRGNPRWINALSASILKTCAAQQTQVADREILEAAATEVRPQSPSEK